MRLIKGVLFVLSGLFLVITLISLLMPSTVIVNRSEIIPGDSTDALIQINKLENWRNWHPALEGAKVTQGALPNGNQYLQWESSKKNYRLEEVLKYSNGIRVALKRRGENDVINDVTVSRAGLQNQVEWRAINKIKWYPWEKFGALFLNDLTGPGYEESLKRLKDYLAAN